MVDVPQGRIRVPSSRFKQRKKRLANLDRELQAIEIDIDRTSTNLDLWSRTTFGNHKIYTYWLNHYQKITARWQKLDQERYEVRCRLKGYNPKKGSHPSREFPVPVW